MKEDTPWKWANDPDITRKKCKYCQESMIYGRSSAVKYKDEIYHDHCLLTFLAKYHTDNTTINDSPQEYKSTWSITP
jgi:hypothetical protein